MHHATLDRGGCVGVWVGGGGEGKGGSGGRGEGGFESGNYGCSLLEAYKMAIATGAHILGHALRSQKPRTTEQS